MTFGKPLRAPRPPLQLATAAATTAAGAALATTNTCSAQKRQARELQLKRLNLFDCECIELWLVPTALAEKNTNFLSRMTSMSPAPMTTEMMLMSMPAPAPVPAPGGIPATCYHKPTGVNLAFGIVLIIGALVAYIPQYIAIVRRKSSKGLSLEMLALGLIRYVVAAIVLVVGELSKVRCAAHCGRDPASGDFQLGADGHQRRHHQLAQRRVLCHCV